MPTPSKSKSVKTTMSSAAARFAATDPATPTDAPADVPATATPKEATKKEILAELVSEKTDEKIAPAFADLADFNREKVREAMKAVRALLHGATKKITDKEIAVALKACGCADDLNTAICKIAASSKLSKFKRGATNLKNALKSAA